MRFYRVKLLRTAAKEIKQQIIKDYQLKASGNEDRKELDFHKMILNEELPFTIGGGIGQSRICMFFLNKAHIGEVQASIWDEKNIKICRENDINLL